MTAEVPGKLIGAGRSADVYDIGDGRVLRRYRDGRPAELVDTEAQVMVHARTHGVPVPEVFDVSGTDIVMERVTGPTMLDAVGRQPWKLMEQARLLARLHELVHRVPVADLSGLPVPLPLPSGPGDVLLHRDLHPQNVILTADGPVIIDWEGAAQGPAAADVAMTWVLLGFSEIPGPRLKAFALGRFQALFTRTFVQAAGGLDEHARMTAVRLRLADHHLLPAEAARLEKLAGN